MKRRDYDNALRELVFFVFVAPVVILVSMFVVGGILDGFLHTSNTFSYIFLIVGGVPAVGVYYKSEWDRLSNRRRSR